MKWFLSFILFSTFVLQISCGPRTSAYRSTHVLSPANTNSGNVPSWVQNLDPSTKLVHLAGHNNSKVVSDFLRSNTAKIKPIYVSLALDKAITKGDLEMTRLILDSTGNDKKIHATAALGKVKTKKMLDFLVAQGGEINGFDNGKASDPTKNTIAVLAKNGPLMNMGNSYHPETARLLVEAGADPYREIFPNHTVFKGIEQLVDAFAKHDSLRQQTENLKQIVQYLKTSTKLSDIERIVISGTVAQLKQSLNKSNINQVNKRGFTLLHHAARSARLEMAKYLISKKPSLLKIRNNANKTPLDLVKSKKDAVAKYLSCSQNKLCRSVASFDANIRTNCATTGNINKCREATRKDIHGVFITKDISDMVAKTEYASACKKFSYKNCQLFIQQFPDSEYLEEAKAAIENYKNKRAESMFAAACGDKGSTGKCNALNAKYPGMIAQPRMVHAIAFLSQKCRLNEAGWIYTGSQCKAGKAHGNGEAINTDKSLSYKGQFSNGQRTKGKVFYDGQPMFDGALAEGKPNGIGVCFHKGDPEKCEFYEGKRIDVLFKQRIAMVKQQEQMDKKLSEMKSMQEQQNKRISQMQGQVRSQQSVTSKSDTGGVGQQIGDYALKKAGEKVMDKLFDSLF